MHSLPKRLGVAVASTFGLLLLATGLASVVAYKPYGVRDSQRGEYEKILSDIHLKAELLSLKEVADLPTAVAVAPTYDFGMMAPHDSRTHQFRIENHGKGMLALEVLGTSCKCTTGKLSKDIIPPGDFCELEVAWNTGQPGEEYLQSVMLKTNDPVNKNIELRIQGQVFSDLVIPDSVGMPKGDLGEVLEAEFLVHSQVYNDISLLAVECDLPGFQWSAEPASDKDVELLHSTTKSAVKVKILCKPVRRGEFASTMALKLITDSGATIERSINCSGKLRASISFYDANIYMKEGLDMGTLTSGKRHEFAIIVRADDKERDLEVLRVEPPEVKATIKPLGQSGAYRLVIYVPEDCPTVIFNLDSKRGYVEVGDPDEKSYSNWLPIYGAVARPEL